MSTVGSVGPQASSTGAGLRGGCMTCRTANGSRSRATPADGGGGQAAEEGTGRRVWSSGVVAEPGRKPRTRLPARREEGSAEQCERENLHGTACPGCGGSAASLRLRGFPERMFVSSSRALALTIRPATRLIALPGKQALCFGSSSKLAYTRLTPVTPGDVRRNALADGCARRRSVSASMVTTIWPPFVSCTSTPARSAESSCAGGLVGALGLGLHDQSWILP